ncbi:hypothetical protein VTK26DRAFT_8929 [Humicola hyalothermophila]
MLREGINGRSAKNGSKRPDCRVGAHQTPAGVDSVCRDCNLLFGQAGQRLSLSGIPRAREPKLIAQLAPAAFPGARIYPRNNSKRKAKAHLHFHSGCGHGFPLLINGAWHLSWSMFPSSERCVDGDVHFGVATGASAAGSPLIQVSCAAQYLATC